MKLLLVEVLNRQSPQFDIILRSKKGDFVVNFGNDVGKKLVIELKDVDKQLSVAEIQEELKEAKQNRNADFHFCGKKCRISSQMHRIFPRIQWTQSCLRSWKQG
jgi:hypothetical protein